MKLISVVNARKMLDSLSNIENIGAHLAYWMTKFILVTEGDDDFYTKRMAEILKDYKTENGDYKIPKEKLDEVNKAVEDLQNTEIEDPKIRFSLSEISQELKLSMKQIYPLMEFIDEEK